MRQSSFLCLLALTLLTARAADDYTLGPDSFPQDGVPRGHLEKLSWTSTNLFPGTVRDYWIYVPAQYDAAKPACVMVFQDGGGYVSTNGSYRVPTVFDNLIHKKEMPVTIGIFINPGVMPAQTTNALPRFNRSLEYDGLGDRYARFLLEEMLPAVAKKYNLATDANSRAIAGASSGAIAAFTAAWERPEAFARVFSTIGTYVGLRGGNDYPTLIRKTEPKALRVFLQDGSADQNIYGGNWWIANLDMLSALEFAGYEVNHAWGDGGHNGKHGGSIFPEAMRWLWKDFPQRVAKGKGSRQPVMQLLIPGEEWQLVSEGHKFTEGPIANRKGEVFFSDIPNNRIHKVGLDGKVTVFAENTGGANGLAFDPSGKLHACANTKKQIVSYDDEGHEKVVLEDAPANDFVALPKGGYYTDPGNQKVWHLNDQGERKLVDTGLGFANGVTVSPDQSLLYVADSRARFVYSYQIQPDGSLVNKSPYFHLHIPDGATGSGADGIKVDAAGWLYVATSLGVQICDQAGRVNAIISKPQRGPLANIAFGGEKLNELYATCGDKVYKRKVRAKGVYSFEPPIKPAPPRL
jgi:sugar lactone lactonase YvrE/enterochelin esterase-like enzyme